LNDWNDVIGKRTWWGAGGKETEKGWLGGHAEQQLGQQREHQPEQQQGLRSSAGRLADAPPQAKVRLREQSLETHAKSQLGNGP